ncbi:MAG: fatty acyl-AMP ligase [Wenzhouxiangellaceae bacterium]
MLYTALDQYRHRQATQYHFLSGKIAAQSRSPAQIYQAAETIASNLQQLGIDKGDRVCLVIADQQAFIECFFACILNGAVAVPLSPPGINTRQASYDEKLLHVLNASQTTLLVTDCLELNDELISPDMIKVSSTDELLQATTAMLKSVALSPDDTCFLQFTSGSTGMPKGVIVSYRNLDSNIGAMVRTLNVTEDDVVVSWLPMHHDMGLIGKVLTPLHTGCKAVYIPTSRFIRNPGLWLSALSEYRGTLSFGPNFSLALVSKRMQRVPKGELDLSSVRVLGCGAEPINDSVLRQFIETLQPYGLQPTAVLPSYGMAEATLAVSFKRYGSHFRSMTIDRQRYFEDRTVAIADDQTAEQITIVSCGEVFDDFDIRIVDEQNQPLAEGRVGEILLRGDSVCSGYFNNPVETQRAFVDGWLRTGDQGYLYDGQLYICGRTKDVVIVNGKNIFPQDIEWRIDLIEGMRAGGTVAIGVPDNNTEQLYLICELRNSNEIPEADITRECYAACGVAPHQVIYVKTGSLPKTTSGKIMRSKVRSLLSENQLARL